MTTGVPRESSGASPRALELGTSSRSELEQVLLGGTSPAIEDLVGWEFRGINTPPWIRLLGIRKFFKGFFDRGDGIYGYNCPAVQNALGDPWRALPTDQAPKRFGFYSVEPVDPESRDNRYVNAVFLDYGRGDNLWFDPSARLRDYLVQVDAHNPDLFLGKAYIAVAGARVPSPGFFVLERHRRVEVATPTPMIAAEQCINETGERE